MGTLGPHEVIDRCRVFELIDVRRCAFTPSKLPTFGRRILITSFTTAFFYSLRHIKLGGALSCELLRSVAIHALQLSD